MSNTNKTTIIVGIIGAFATILAAFIASNYSEQKIMKNLQNSIGEVSGNNNHIALNDVNDFVKDYEKIKVSNDRYANQLEDANKEIEGLKNQIGDTPIFKFSDLGLTIDGEEISLDSTNSMVTIDGREYLDKSFVDNLLTTNQTLTIKGENAYIGKVIKDKASLNDQWVVDSDATNFPDNVTDSYGNMYTNAIEFTGSDCYSIFNLNKEFALLKCRFSIKEDANSNVIGQVIIKADDAIVYRSPTLDKKKEPFIKADIPIKNCTLLTIEYHSENYGYCIISDASVYN